MPIPPVSVGEEKLTKAVNLSRPRAGQVQGYDPLRMRRSRRIELDSG